MQRVFLLGSCLMFFLVLASGCESKKNLDGAVDKLRTSIEKSDYEAFSKLVPPEMLTQIPKEKFEFIGQSLGKLGAFKERSMKSISVQSGKPSNGKYVLSYEKGDLDLEIAVLDDGTIVQFNLTGEALVAAQRELANRELAIRRFEFTEGKKGPKRVSTVFKSNEEIHFAIEAIGMKVDEGGLMHPAIDVRVTKEDGSVLFENKGSAGNVKAEGGVPTVTFTNVLKVPDKGAYRFQVVMRDTLAGKDVKAEQAFAIE